MTDYAVANLALRRLAARELTSFTDTNNPNSAAIGDSLDFHRRELLAMYQWPIAMKQAVLIEIGDSAYANATAYAAGAHVTNSNRLYVCITAGTSAAAPGAGPTTTASDITDGTAHFKYKGDIETNITEWAYRYPVPYDCLRIRSIDDGDQYERIGSLIYTNAEDPTIRYVWDMDSCELWDDIMIDALVLRLAGALALLISGKDRPDLTQEFSAFIQMARIKQASEGREKPAATALWTETT